MQISISTDGSSQRRLLKEAESYRVMLYEDRPLDLEIPPSVVLEVVETDPGVKGDTVTGASVPATLKRAWWSMCRFLWKSARRSRSTRIRANTSAANSACIA